MLARQGRPTPRSAFRTGVPSALVAVALQILYPLWQLHDHGRPVSREAGAPDGRTVCVQVEQQSFAHDESCGLCIALGLAKHSPSPTAGDLACTLVVHGAAPVHVASRAPVAPTNLRPPARAPPPPS